MSQENPTSLKSTAPVALCTINVSFTMKAASTEALMDFYETFQDFIKNDEWCAMQMVRMDMQEGDVVALFDKE